VVTSTHFASARASDIRPVQWDLVVIDEAHKLRNAYRPSNRMGQNIRWALEDRRKVLLTATPLQNSLVELYGISTIIDGHIFGDLPSFRSQFVNAGGDMEDLRNRLRTFSIRTLRRQVVEYIQYTERRLITRPFKPTEQEHKLYEAVSAFPPTHGHLRAAASAAAPDGFDRAQAPCLFAAGGGGHARSDARPTDRDP
jgi:SNF2 family DNA or RNA helicase